ncbi:MAG: GAK system XXXCH domain-containing protein [Desulfovibrionales bacterium]|nr:GAK system XXXCH domain-containing protein [Desulfovibrionales bacterium]
MTEKFKDTIKREHLPTFFRRMAEACEGHPSHGFPPCEKAKKIRLSIKDEYGQLSVKLKTSAYADECDQCEDCICGGKRPDGLPRYKRLKKRMGTSFKVIFKALHANTTPPEEAVHDFISDSRLMTKYPGKGEPLYARYNSLVDALEAAWNDKDMSKFHETLDALNHIKTEGHHRFK